MVEPGPKESRSRRGAICYVPLAGSEVEGNSRADATSTSAGCAGCARTDGRLYPPATLWGKEAPRARTCTTGIYVHECTVQPRDGDCGSVTRGRVDTRQPWTAHHNETNRPARIASISFYYSKLTSAGLRQ
nr:hypothetical protein CFP56_37201 [Quercus suber]